MWHYASSGRPSDEPYCPWPRIFVSVLAVHAPSTLPIQRSWDCQLMRGLPPKCPCTEHWCPDRGMGASAMVHTSSGAQGESPTVMETCNQVGKGKKPYERDRPVPAVADGAQGAAPHRASRYSKERWYVCRYAKPATSAERLCNPRTARV